MTKRRFFCLENIWGACLVGLLLTITPAPSYAESVSKRLEKIEKQLTALQRKVFTPGSQFPQEGGSPAVGSQPAATGVNVGLANIEDRISQMETQLRHLTGRIEENNFQVDRLKQQMETMAQDYEFRFKALEKPGAQAADTAGQPAAPSEGAKIGEAMGNGLPEGTEKEQYSYAQKLVTMGKYTEAEAALMKFLELYPKSELAGNAQYWLGQTFYVRKMYTKSTRAFLEGYNNYPKNPKAPAFLLKIGMSLFAMGETADACDAYRELAARFPDSNENISKRPAEAKRAGCK